QTEDFPGGMKYTMFKQDGQKVAGLMQQPHDQAPAHWLAYVEVENVDAAAKKAGGMGAKILMPPMDIPTVGRIAVFQDPQGAALGWRPPSWDFFRNARATRRANNRAPGSCCWAGMVPAGPGPAIGCCHRNRGGA